MTAALKKAACSQVSEQEPPPRQAGEPLFFKDTREQVGQYAGLVGCNFA